MVQEAFNNFIMLKMCCILRAEKRRIYIKRSDLFICKIFLTYKGKVFKTQN